MLFSEFHGNIKKAAEIFHIAVRTFVFNEFNM